MSVEISDIIKAMNIHQQSPFRISLSKNAEIFEFNEQWNYKRHYKAVFNAQTEVVHTHFLHINSWAMIADWRKWIVQVPDSERLCIRALYKFVEQGLRYYAIISDGHPISQWQANRVKVANPNIAVGVFSSIPEGIHWLETNGFDIEFKHSPFKKCWFNSSESFNNILTELKVSNSTFSI